MNTKVTWGVLVVAVILASVAYYVRSTPAGGVVVAPQTFVATTTPTTSSTPSQSSPSPEPKVPTATKPQVDVQYGSATIEKVPASANFDTSSLVSTSSYPVITGTANVSKISILISNSKGDGLVATKNVPVVNGRWAYYCSVALVPADYKVSIYDGISVQNATLVVEAP